MGKIIVSEWMWRFLAFAMLFAVSWTLWIIYQLSPPPLVTNAAFEAAANAKRGDRKSSVQGVIVPPAGNAASSPSEAPAVTAVAGAASAPAENLPNPVVGAIASAPAEAPPKPIAPAAAAVEPPKPAAEKPAPEKPVVAKSSEAEVVEAVASWAKAWSSKDADAYLAAYAKDFKTPGGEARADWEKARRQRIGAPKSITVKLDAIKVRLAGEGRASVTFRQDYRSDVIDPIVSTKTLEMARIDGRWLIQQEKSGN
jgi:hypothetical protein